MPPKMRSRRSGGFAPDAAGHVATGSGFWHFGTDGRRDAVEIIGSKGHIRFSVFQDESLQLTVNGVTEEIFIENPQHIQQYHVANIAAQLRGDAPHPSSGDSAIRATAVMEQILAGRAVKVKLFDAPEITKPVYTGFVHFPFYQFCGVLSGNLLIRLLRPSTLRLRNQTSALALTCTPS